jgi:hypothetical protein
MEELPGLESRHRRRGHELDRVDPLAVVGDGGDSALDPPDDSQPG